MLRRLYPPPLSPKTSESYIFSWRCPTSLILLHLGNNLHIIPMNMNSELESINLNDTEWYGLQRWDFEFYYVGECSRVEINEVVARADFESGQFSNSPRHFPFKILVEEPTNGPVGNFRGKGGNHCILRFRGCRLQKSWCFCPKVVRLGLGDRFRLGDRFLARGPIRST